MRRQERHAEINLHQEAGAVVSAIHVSLGNAVDPILPSAEAELLRDIERLATDKDLAIAHVKEVKDELGLVEAAEQAMIGSIEKATKELRQSKLTVMQQIDSCHEEQGAVRAAIRRLQDELHAHEEVLGASQPSSL